MRVILRVINGPHANKRFILNAGQSATFGRTPLADYEFADDALMSGRHFSVGLKAENCLIRDLDSRNGTFVNDKRVIEHALDSNSVIQAGDTKFAVMFEDSASPVSSSGTAFSPVGVAPVVKPPDFAQVPGSSSPVVPTSPGALLAAELATTSKSSPTAAVPSIARTQVALPLELRRSGAPREYELALADDDPIVRRNALLAATWKGHTWVLEYCRALASPALAENWEALLLLAILGQSEDLPRIHAIGRASALGSQRFHILAAFGHPDVMADLVAAMESKDAAVALAAGAAITKITGVDIRSEVDSAPLENTRAQPESIDGFPGGFSLLDRKAAEVEWQNLKRNYPDGTRWCRGFDLTRGLPPGALECFDLESRWEACLRGRFTKTWKSTPFDDEQLADKLSS